jgi:hypothetical protein
LETNVDLEWLLHECPDKFANTMDMIVEHDDYHLNTNYKYRITLDNDGPYFLMNFLYHKDAMIHYLECAWIFQRLTWNTQIIEQTDNEPKWRSLMLYIPQFIESRDSTSPILKPIEIDNKELSPLWIRSLKKLNGNQDDS